ncbi:MAG: triosephosphate isomerase [Anaerolineaceae bacterium]|nr:MAG: triosephosphate isomerase [Anaerolineaceae bacterium]
MKKIFVNLKRFEVSTKKGGICPMENPLEWTEWVIEESVRLGLGKIENVFISYFLPEALIPMALETLKKYPDADKKGLSIGCQSVFRDDIRPGGNFGAFTANRPATAMKEIGCEWTIIAHSEERRDKLQMLMAYDPDISKDDSSSEKAYAAIDGLLNEQVKRATEKDLKVVFCIGESAEQKGAGGYKDYAPRVKAVLEKQLKNGLGGVDEAKAREIVIGYEPIWAIGPGKTPPDSDYITFVSKHIKDVTEEMFGAPLDVIYGGGLKEENAKSIAAVDTIDGGLVALTKFVQPIGFDPQSFKNIVMSYVE